MLTVAASGLFGGLRPTEKPTVPVIAVHTAFDGGPWTVTVNRALTLKTLEPLKKTEKAGDRWVAVRVRMEINADETWNRIDDVIRLPGVKGLRTVEPSEFYLVRDESLLVRELQPGIPEEVAFLWQQDGSVPRPEAMDVELWGMTHRKSSLTDMIEWLDSGPRALVLDVPVEDR